MVTVVILVISVLTMPLGPQALPQTVTLPPVGFIITLMHLRALMAVTTSLRSWNDHNAFERMQRLFPKIGVSIVFTIEFVVFVVHLTCEGQDIVEQSMLLHNVWRGIRLMLSRQIQTTIQIREGRTSSRVTSWRTGRQIAVHVCRALISGGRAQGHTEECRSSVEGEIRKTGGESSSSCRSQSSGRCSHGACTEESSICS